MCFSPLSQRIGILGGTFDPVHNGHISIAQSLLSILALDSLRFLPCSQHAFGKQPKTTVEQRVEMLKMAIKESPYFEIDQREINRSGVSYSITSCKEIRDQVGVDAILCFIVGSDVLASLHHWHQWDRLLEYVNLVVVSRAKTVDSFIEPVIDNRVQSLLDAAVEKIDAPNGQLIRVSLPAFPYSSTQIRKACGEYWLSKDRCFENKLPINLEVFNYMIKNRLYRHA